MATDKPQAVTLGRHLQQLQCCTPWQTAMMPIHRGDLFLTKLSITTHIVYIMPLHVTGYTHVIKHLGTMLLEKDLCILCRNTLSETSCLALQHSKIRKKAYMNMVH